jgi:hypothetical protein
LVDKFDRTKPGNSMWSWHRHSTLSITRSQVLNVTGTPADVQWMPSPSILRPGASYTITYRARLTKGSASLWVLHQAWDAASTLLRSDSATQTINGSWVTGQIHIVVPAGSTHDTIAFMGPNGTLQLDDLTIIAG